MNREWATCGLNRGISVSNSVGSSNCTSRPFAYLHKYRHFYAPRLLRRSPLPELDGRWKLWM
uniref:Uncharacterized protein n=1 Tax=Cucumis melo TaxID=3656 RepID=A0A9I9EI11_CUCME